MKKFLYPFFTLAALLPLLIACNDFNKETKFEDPAFLAYAGHLSLQGIQTNTKAMVAAASEESVIVSFELTESGYYYIGRLTGDEVSYTSGHYTVSGNEYELNGFGVLLFDNSKTGMVQLRIKPDGGKEEVISALFQKPLGTNMAYRTWKVEKTRVTAKGWVTVSAEFNGCDFQEIANFLKENSHKVPDDVPDRSVSSLTLTGTEKMIITYSDGSADFSEFSLSGNVITYQVNKYLGFTFETDQAIIEYEDGKCLLTINGRIRNSTTSGSVAFVLSPIEEKVL